MLNPTIVHVIENGTFALTCTTSYGSRDFIFWFYNEYGVAVQPTYNGEDCEILEGSGPMGAIFSCSGNNIYNVNVTHVTRNNNGDKWRCREYSSSTLIDSNVVPVDVYGKRM